MYSLSAASPFFLDIFGKISPDIEAGIRSAILPAILTWFITGLIMGFLVKRWDDGFFSGLLCSLIVWVFIMIVARIAILGDAILGILEIGYALIVFMLLVNSAAAILICIGGGVVGGLIYSKVLFRKRALIEQYM